ncbi:MULTISPECIES: hypothetical protein [Natrialbaceae]|uniref:hypothetical protein n=1 Tax=Natrialbaceae TaxID=1644061 RepID=UPI00207C5E9D|nr:hypothetical protein [Natronococcus sp. CG52]
MTPGLEEKEVKVNGIPVTNQKKALNRQIREYVDYSDSTLNSMSAEDKRELLAAFEEKATTVNVKANRDGSYTTTRKVEIPAPSGKGESTTVTKECEVSEPWKVTNGKFNREMKKLREKEKRRREEQAERRRERQDSSQIFIGYTNVDEFDDDNSNIPVAGQRSSDEGGDS